MRSLLPAGALPPAVTPRDLQPTKNHNQQVYYHLRLPPLTLERSPTSRCATTCGYAQRPTTYQAPQPAGVLPPAVTTCRLVEIISTPKPIYNKLHVCIKHCLSKLYVCLIIILVT